MYLVTHSLMPAWFSSLHIFLSKLDTLQFRINVHYVYSFLKLFSTLYSVIGVYTLINFQDKNPNYMFILAYTIINLASSIKNYTSPGLLQLGCCNILIANSALHEVEIAYRVIYLITQKIWDRQTPIQFSQQFIPVFEIQINLLSYFLPICLLDITKKFLPILFHSCLYFYYITSKSPQLYYYLVLHCPIRLLNFKKNSRLYTY